MKLPYASGKVELTSKFGWRTLNGAANNHKGIDLVGRTTKTVVAPCDGVIGQSAIFDKATDKTGTWEWGNYVRIDTEDGLKIYLCHLAERKVKAGDRVKAGDVVGIEGNTGYSFGNHLHFEIRKNGASVNPCTYLGIDNAWGIHEVAPAVKGGDIVEKEEIKVERTDSEPQEWAKDAVEWAVENGIIYGDGQGNLMLREPCTREQMIVFLYRAFRMMRGG